MIYFLYQAQQFEDGKIEAIVCSIVSQEDIVLRLTDFAHLGLFRLILLLALVTGRSFGLSTLLNFYLPAGRSHALPLLIGKIDAHTHTFYRVIL